MDLETPSRDTDTLENESAEKKSNDALAFTIDFGDTDDMDEKTKKFERFAQRSSLRQLKTRKEDKIGSSIVDSEREMQSDKKRLTRTAITRHARSDIATDAECDIDIKDTVNNAVEDTDDNISQAGTYVMEEEDDIGKVKYHYQLIN